MQRDYQGSIIAISDASGAVLEKRIFDAWGAIVKVEDGAGNVLAGLTILDRGYTGHEHLQSVGGMGQICVKPNRSGVWRGWGLYSIVFSARTKI